MYPVSSFLRSIMVFGHLVPTSPEPFHHTQDISEFSEPVHKTTKVVNNEIILVQNDQIGNVMFI